MPTYEIELPVFYPAQVELYRLLQANRFVAARWGRRSGKTDFGKAIACNALAKGQSVGWFAPDYRIMAEAFNEIVSTIHPIKQSSSKIEGVIRTITKGRIDLWTLENERAGRSRKYHWAIIDEAAFGKPNVMSIWEKSIKPTLLDYGGKALALSNANGIAPDNFFYQICTEKDYGFIEHHGPTHQNPHLPREEIEKLQRENHPLVYRQEYLAEFVDWRSEAFFTIDKMLVDGEPVPYPSLCDSVFAVIDTAVKTGTANDGTAVSYWCVSQHVGHKMICLDYDLIQIEGALLEVWIPNVFRRLEELARDCRARMGSIGAFIEDAQSGSILLQQCRNKGLPATALPQKLTAAGKDARAISISGYVYQGLVKFSRYAYEKTVTYKGATRNHMLTQVVGFRVGDKDAATRSDDALDTFCYAIAMGLGNNEGY